jgi:hypothetical protein
MLHKPRSSSNGSQQSNLNSFVMK